MITNAAHYESCKSECDVSSTSSSTVGTGFLLILPSRDGEGDGVGVSTASVGSVGDANKAWRGPMFRDWGVESEVEVGG
jgi:hypothetical protein